MSAPIQPDLFAGLDGEDKTIRERFLAFHEKHPEVYVMFCRFASDAIKAGRQRIGARAIWERMRWETQVAGSDSGFRLNDHFPPLYARLWLSQNPDRPDFFLTRKQRCKGAA